MFDLNALIPVRIVAALLAVAALMASPAVWQGDDLVAAPLAGMTNGWRAELQESAEAFFAALLSN